MSNAINTINAANNGITAITKLVQSAQSLVSQARQTTDTSTLDTLSTQFDALLTQIGQLAGDFGFNGVNLLGGDLLTVNFNEDASSSTTISGVDYTNANASPLSINAAGNWQTSSNIDLASTNLSAALTKLRAELQTLSANLSTVQIRQDFTKSTINTLQNGSAALTLADFERRRRELARLADTPAAVDHSAVALRAGRPERAAPVPISRSYRRRNGGLRAAVFFRAIQLWLTVS